MWANSSPPPPADDAASVPPAVRARERGLSLLKRTNRWLIGLAVLLAGALSGLTAHDFHAARATAQTTSSPAANTGNGGGTASPSLPSPDSAPSAAAPSPAPGPGPSSVGPVVSGGS